MSKPKLSPVVATLNMKGGVGKTTVSAHVFRVFFERFKAGTLLVDIDPQFNLTQTLFKKTVYEKLKDDGKTVMAAMEPLPTACSSGSTACRAGLPPTGGKGAHRVSVGQNRFTVLFQPQDAVLHSAL